MKEHDFQKYFYECRSLLCVKKLFPNLYINPLKERKIDILDYDSHTGIEVTICVNEGAKSEIEDIKKGIFRENRIKNRYKINNTIIVRSKNKANTDNKNLLIACCFVGWEMFLSCFKRKLQKLDEHYSKIINISNYDLYIIDAFEIGLENCDIENLLKRMIILQENMKFKYRYVFIQRYITIHIFDLKEKSYTYKKISANLYESIKKEAEILAKQLIIKARENKDN